MNYSYEAREDGIYLVSDEAVNDEYVCVKLNNKFKKETILESLIRETFTLTWEFQRNEEREDVLDIVAKINGEEYRTGIDVETLLSEFVHMVKQDLNLISCKNFINAINETYQMIFETFLEQRNYVLASSYPIKANIVVTDIDGVKQGGASRFCFNSYGELYICEFAGKKITRSDELIVNCYFSDLAENNKLKFKTTDIIHDSEEVYDPIANGVALIKTESVVEGIDSGLAEFDTIPNMNYYPYVSNNSVMISYFFENNSPELIAKYKAAIKPKVQLINVNRYILNEFSV